MTPLLYEKNRVSLKIESSQNLEKSKELLAVKSLSVAQVASMTGFEDALYFSRVFRKYVGMAPSDYRKISN